MTHTVTTPHWLLGRGAIFACYHGPSSAPRDLGVVICNSFGLEMMCTHRALRHLAETLAAAGMPTLRFDYDATGDSSGGEADPDRGPAWLASIDVAVRALAHKGVKRIALVGVRLGALLAADYAKARPVDALALIAPPASGRAYLRELRALHSLRLGPLGETTAHNGAHEGQEVVGFTLSPSAVDYLNDLTIPGSVKLADRVLVIARDDLPGQEAKLVQKLAQLGSQVTLSTAAGYAGMSDGNPVNAVVPAQMWRTLVEWLSDTTTQLTTDVSFGLETRATHVHINHAAAPVREEVVDVDGMFGILTTPVQTQPGAPVVVLSNVGANHHVGSNRLYVDLARHWAGLGFATLRFDLVGIGDTPATPGRRENEVYAELGIVDVCRTIDWLAASRKYERFVLSGICSGAYVSYYAALADARVDGLMLMNPLTFHWHEGDSLDVRARNTFKSTYFYRRAAMQLGTWKRVARGQVHVRGIARKIAERAWMRLAQWPARWLQRDTDVALGFRRLCSRGTRVMLVCGEDDGSCDVVADHLGPDAERLRKYRDFRFEIVPHTDHTFAPKGARRDLSGRLTSFLVEGAWEAARRGPRSAPPRALQPRLVWPR